LVLRHFLTTLGAVAIFELVMAASLCLPNSAHEKLPLTKSVSDAELGPVDVPMLTEAALLAEYFRKLFDAHGPQHWWPGRSRFEVIVGAILTQSTSWTNVEAAIKHLRTARLLTPHAMESVSPAQLARLIRPSGYFRQKAKKLKAFTHFLFSAYGGSLKRMFRTQTAELRERLLSVHGIGPETADAILLYAGKHPVFVVDAYTRRIVERHGLATSKHSYEGLRSLFESSLPREAQLFNEFHALIVYTGKHHCRKTNPVCSACPLEVFLPDGDAR
jgi:endonuclease III related protein